MSQKRLVDLTTLIAGAFKGERYHAQAERFFEKVDKGEVRALVLDLCSIEAEMLYLSRRIKIVFEEWMAFIKDLLENPKIEKVPLSSNVFAEHLKLYKGFNGKYTYFDSFHAAAAKVLKVSLTTTDEALLSDLDVPTDDLKKY